MKFMRIKLLLFFSIFFISPVVLAQKYSKDKKKFIKEFQKSLAEYGRGEFNDFSKKEFPELLFNDQVFNEKKFLKMVEICNQIEQKKLKAYPDVYNYVYSISSFLKTKKSSESFIAWENTVDKFLSARNVKKFVDFIDMSEGLFRDSCIVSFSSFAWYYEGGSFYFEYDKKSSIHFQGGNLVCKLISKKNNNRKFNTIDIIYTSGVYDPIIKKWNGLGGRITWGKVGLDINTNYADINKYDLTLKKSKIKIDSVKIKTKYFDDFVEGVIIDRAFKESGEDNQIYPQFSSYNTRLLIKNIVPNVDYIGGFSLKGASFFGLGKKLNKAQITINQDGSPLIIARGSEVYIKSKNIYINKSTVSFYLSNGDSLYHPGLNFNYDLDKKKIQFTRTNLGIGQSPFQDSYHNIYIYVPKVVWDVGSDNLYFTYEFGTSQEQRIASFESQSYFDPKLYAKLQGQSSVHPLVALSRYCYKYDEYKLSEGSAASALGMTISQAKPMLFRLSNLGFINYDTDNNFITINDKLETFVKAKSGVMDFDNIVFKSDFRPKKLTGYTNDEIKNDSYLQSLQDQHKSQNELRRIKKNFAVLNLNTFDLDISAIDKVLLSEIKQTVVFPSNSQIKLKKNRDFNFSGWIKSGKLEMSVKSAKFEYDSFKLNLMSSDRALFRVMPLREEDSKGFISMFSSISGVSGDILINDPNNKSGVKLGYEHYPKLISTNTSKVFYNNEDIYNSAYDSTRFYYSVFPFQLDSLNDFNENFFRLKGKLVSAGIFPEIEEDLIIMPDYSFGFYTSAPNDGFQFYNTDSKYDNRVVLSNNGLQGEGTINFVHSKSTSNLLTFLPDSTIGIAQFENSSISKGFQFPDVIGEKAYVTYLPKKELLKVKSFPENELFFFNQEANLEGSLTVSPKGIVGSGIMSFDNATLFSNNFKYNSLGIYADTSKFNLKNQNIDKNDNSLAFKTDNVNADVSFKERKGVFKSNEGESLVEFPINQYSCKMDQFTWFMDDLSIEMQTSEDQKSAVNSGVDLLGPNFFSTHPNQDSLNFRAPQAKFDLKEKTIFCQKVEYVDIGDARIYPDSMKLNIRKQAKIDKLFNAKIVANYITRYHKFEKAEVQINARRDYLASGEYPYYDLDSNLTYISMNNIKLDSSYQTQAFGEITQDAAFKLSDKFDYYGDINIYASNPLISFSGAVRINHLCDKFYRNWMAFTSEIDPENIQIPVTKEMKDLDGNPISAGIVWRNSPSTDSIKVYPTFLSQLVDVNDPIIMTSDGYLQYDYGSNEFQIGSSNKLVNRSDKGNYIALHTESCSMSGDGIISLGMDYGDVTIDAVGVMNYNQENEETSMNITARFNIDLDNGLMEGLASKINSIEGLKSMDFSSTTLEQAIVQWDNQEVADKMKDEYVRLGNIKKIPSTIKESITISGLRLSSFNNEKLQDKGLITNVQSAIIVNFYDQPIMKYLPIKAFFQKTYSTSGADMFGTYINIPGGNDYFFHYAMKKKDGTLKVFTNDIDFNANLNNIKEEKRKKKRFKYELTNNSVYLSKFLNFFK